MFQMLSVNTSETQGHMMNLRDLLNVKLYTDHLKMWNQVWEETSVAVDNDLDESVLENLCEKWKNVYTH